MKTLWELMKEHALLDFKADFRRALTPNRLAQYRAAYDGEPMKTLYEIITDPMLHQRSKHNLSNDYVERALNEMSRDDFLRTISDALEERLAQETKDG